MAIIYVDSSAAGANDGSSWANAYTSINSTNGAAAGDEIYVENNHSQGTMAAIDWTNGLAENPVIISSRDSSDDSYTPATSAQFTSSDMDWTGGISVWGIYWDGSDDALLDADGERQEYIDCNVRAGDVINVTGRHCWTGCTINHNDFFNVTNSHIELHNCTLDQESNYSRATIFTGFGYILMSSCNIGAYDATLTGIGGGARVDIYSSIVPDETPTATTANAQYVALNNCHTSAILNDTPPLAIRRTGDASGEVTTSTSSYRTGGADDGEQANAYSLQMATNANAIELYRPLVSPTFGKWLSGSETSIKVYVASGGTLNDDDFWITVESPSEVASPNQTAQATFESTRMTLDGTPAALTTDSSSTWNGSGVGTKQEISVTIAPTIAGLCTVRAYLAKPSTTIYVDPKIEAS